MDELNRRSAFRMLGAIAAGSGAVLAPGAAQTQPKGPMPDATRGIDVRAYGAVADDRTDNAAAFEAAIAAAVAAGRPILVPAARKAYATSRPLKAVTGIIGEGRGSVIRALSAEAFRGGRGIIHIGWRRADDPAVCTVPVASFRVIGAATRPARRSSDPKTIGFEGAGIFFDESAAFIHMIDVGVEFCRKGIVHATLNGHIGGTNVNCSNNWYNLYWERNTGDFRYIDCVLTGALFATYGCHGSRRSDADFGGLFGLATIGCHGGFSPFLFYQEDGDGTVGLVGWTSINSSCEQIGNQVIRLGRTSAGKQRVCADWFVVMPGHSWTAPGTPEHAAYAITDDPAVPVQRYAVDLDLVQGGTIHIQGIGWIAGSSGRHTRIANLLAWLSDDNGIGGYEVTGGGSERLTHARSPRLRQSRKVSMPLRGGGAREVMQFAFPPSYDNTPGGELTWSLAYRVRTAQPVALRFIVRVEGQGTTADQVLTPQVVSNGIGNLSGSADISIGRRDRAGDKHSVRLLVEVPAGVDLAMLEGSFSLAIGQDTGMVN